MTTHRILAATAFVAALAALLAGWGGIAIAVAVLGAILLAVGESDALRRGHGSSSASPQTHGGISPHDLPVDHPGREQAEREAAALGGETPGNR